MIRIIVWKELLEHLRSLRFSIGFILIVSLFVVNGIAWNVRYRQEMVRFRTGQREMEEQIQRRANMGLFFVSYGATIWRPCSPLAFCSGGYTHGLPDVARVTAFRIRGFDQKADRNPLLVRVDLDWVFIVGLLGSLIALLMTYDGIAGEKERGSLRMALSNSVPRDILLCGKYLAAMAVVCAPILIGATLALVIISWGGEGGLPPEGCIPLIGTLAGGLLCISAFVWMGLLVSSRTAHSSLSLLVLLTAWAILAVFIPSSGGLIGDKLAPVPRASEVEKRATTAELEKTDDRERVAVRKAIYDDYWRQLIHQIEVAQRGTQISPVAAFRYLGEALCATGVLRYRFFMEQVGQYRRRLLEFVKREDAKDPESSHELIPGHLGAISGRPVRPEEVPHFVFREAPLDDRMGGATESLALLLLFNVVFFAGAYWSFRKYDVR